MRALLGRGAWGVGFGSAGGDQTGGRRRVSAGIADLDASLEVVAGAAGASAPSQASAAVAVNETGRALAVITGGLLQASAVSPVSTTRAIVWQLEVPAYSSSATKLIEYSPGLGNRRVERHLRRPSCTLGQVTRARSARSS